MIRLRKHLLRYLAQEIRWLKPYMSEDHYQFTLTRLGRKDYLEKHWLYFITAPYLLIQEEIFSDFLEKAIKEAEALREKEELRPLNSWERECHAWAANTVDCIRQLRNSRNEFC